MTWQPASPYIGLVPSPLYTRDILRLAAAIPHLGLLPAPQGHAERSSPVCGSRVRVDAVLDTDGRVAGLGQEVRACALGQAAAAIMGAHAIGRYPAELSVARDHLAAFLAGRRADPGDWPGIGALAAAQPYTARHPSILLAFEAAAEAAARAGAAQAVAV